MQAIIFNPHSSPVPNMVIAYQRSVQGSNYAGRNDVVLYDTPGDPPDVAALIAAGVSSALWKVSGGTVVELTQSDKDAIVAAQAAAQAAAAQLALASLKTEILSYYTADRDGLQRAFRAAIHTVIELTVTQLNVLRSQHSLAPLTADQVKSAFLSSYQSKIDAIT